ncbi:pyrroline-5-carboxylate reductase [Patescibacteria group bacterium]|nr:pyrroline-5-carboxylate reductase [Patescibacteria group bacterium]
MKLAVIGGGNMGMAMVSAWLNSGACKASDILVYDRNSTKRNYFKKLKVQVNVSDFTKLIKYDFIFLAVKPQDTESVLKNIKAHLSSRVILVSVAAAVSIKKLSSALGKIKIVRAMPNTPIQIGMGVVGWTGSKNLVSKDKKDVQKLLGAMGTELYVNTEKKLDQLTVISGSGPAYVFYFMEALFESALKIGLNTKEATILILGTFVGASNLVNYSGESPAKLREMVASKKGVTEVAIKEFDKNKLKKIVYDAVKSAYKKVEEFNK